MPNTHSSSPQNIPESGLTLGDVIAFIVKAKWFALAGIIFGLAGAISYLAIVPSVYESKVVIQIQPSQINIASNQITIGSDELLERLTFSQTANQIINTMQPPPNSSSQSIIRDALRLASSTRGGIFLNLTVKAKSATEAQELAGQLGIAISIIISKLNEPRIAYLKKLLISNKALLASGNNKIDIFGLQNSILGLETLLISPESLKPQIVDGPSLANGPASPKSNPILLLGALLGLLLGLFSSYLQTNPKPWNQLA